MKRAYARLLPTGATALLVAIAAMAMFISRGAGAAEAAMSSVPSAAAFRSFIASLRPDAEAQGVSSITFDTALASLEPDPAVAAMTRRQPEELKPVGAYLAAQVTPARAATGRALLARWHADLAAVEHRYSVPAAIVVAVWGLETNYGASPGTKDVIRSMATLAALEYRPALYRAELLSVLVLLERREASRGNLRGSWAGAMGQPQFMPSSFERYAVDWDGDGHRDIWGSVPDVLASIANFLAQQGWRPDRPWGFEVRLPPGFDLQTGRAAFAEWRARGVSRPGGAPLPETGDAVLYFPAGATGPAFLVTENFEVIKTYNFSDAYVLGVGTLADRIAGKPPVAAAWPSDPPISRDDRIALQARLAALGYAVDNREGRISLGLRDTIRSAQARLGMTPDGNPTASLLRALGETPVR